MKTADQVAMEEAVEVAAYVKNNGWTKAQTVDAFNELAATLIVTIGRQEKQIKELEAKNVELQEETARYLEALVLFQE